MPEPPRTALKLFTIPSHCAFADSLARGLIDRFAAEPLALARGRILLPNNRAVRAVTEAFVRESGSGLLLPRLIPIGDPELEERAGGGLESADDAPLPPAIEPSERLFALAQIVGRGGKGAAESLRLAADLARTLDALQVERVSPVELRGAAAEAGDIARHWEKSLAELAVIIDYWPRLLAERGAIDLTQRRNLLLERLAERWKMQPPAGFTVAAGITTAAPAVAELLATIARMAGGEVVLPGLWLADVLPDTEWAALGPDDQGRIEPAHPQFHLKLLLDAIGVARSEVQRWPTSAGAVSPPTRALAVANAMAAPAFSHKWEVLKPRERRLTGVRLAQFPDAPAEAQAIALAIREALETPGKTAALVTPDRVLASRVSALLERWGIEADDSAGQPLARTPAGSLLLAITAAAAEQLAPVALLALLKHPLVGGEGEDRRRWLDFARMLDLALRGPRPAPGLDGLDRHFEARDSERAHRGCLAEWRAIRPAAETVAGWFEGDPPLSALAERIVAAAAVLAGERAWRGPDGRMAAELLADLQAGEGPRGLVVAAEDAVPVLRQLLDARAVRPPYGKHPRVFIWGLLEARLQSADLIIAGGLNEGTWPALPAPDAWLPPKVRSALGMPTLETRIGLAAQSFAGALGAPEVLVTRARREDRSPTVASRFWLRLMAIDPEIAMDQPLVDLARVLDAPGSVKPASRPEPAPASDLRPRRISVTAVDRLRADPYAFYAQKILRLTALDALDADATAAWKGSAVHEVLDAWFREDRCAPATLEPKIDAMLNDEALHPLVRALWRPRLTEAIAWIEQTVAADRAAGREPSASEIAGEATLAGVVLHGKADRIDTLPGGGSAVIDYKTGQAPSKAIIAAGYALQLGLLGLIARAGGFGEVHATPSQLEYWSLAKEKGNFGYRRDAREASDQADFLDWTHGLFERAANDWLAGTRGFKAKLNPAHSLYGDYDQLMRLEEWYANAD